MPEFCSSEQDPSFRETILLEPKLLGFYQGLINVIEGGEIHNSSHSVPHKGINKKQINKNQLKNTDEVHSSERKHTKRLRLNHRSIEHFTFPVPNQYTTKDLFTTVPFTWYINVWLSRTNYMAS